MSEFPIEGERTTIGRTPEADVFLDDLSVSREHAVIVDTVDGLYIDDLDSRNGTFVNRRRIAAHLLADGDEIQIGIYHAGLLRALGTGRRKLNCK